jgi:Fur family ferric uptake transcriptional regulator
MMTIGIDMLRKAFQRNSRQRQAILEEARKVTTHPTAVELYELVRRRLPKISLGTVYRNLELLAKAGLIQKLDIQGTEARFDGNPERHHHVRCVECGRLDDVEDLPVEPVQYEPQDLSGYEIVGHRFEFMGLCPECRRQKAAEQNDALADKGV